MAQDEDEARLHATAVLVGEHGVLIRGPSGAGKSRLALGLIARHGARLIGDDQVLVAARHGRLLARGHPALAGLIERRGQGLLTLPAERHAVIHLVVDREAAPRLPPVNHERVLIHGVLLRRISVSPDDDDPVTSVVAELGAPWALR